MQEINAISKIALVLDTQKWFCSMKRFHKLSGLVVTKHKICIKTYYMETLYKTHGPILTKWLLLLISDCFGFQWQYYHKSKRKRTGRSPFQVDDLRQRHFQEVSFTSLIPVVNPNPHLINKMQSKEIKIILHLVAAKENSNLIREQPDQINKL